MREEGQEKRRGGEKGAEKMALVRERQRERTGGRKKGTAHRLRLPRKAPTLFKYEQAATTTTARI